MKKLALASAAILASGPALADWRLDNGIAIVSPVGGNSTMELFSVMCGDPYMIEVLSRGGPVRPDTGETEADYFYKPGKVEARIDGQSFPLVAAGSEIAVVLFGEGTAAQNYMAPIDADLIEALKSGTMMTLAFDVTPDPNATDDSAHETVAEFPLAGSAEALDAALSSCSGG